MADKSWEILKTGLIFFNRHFVGISMMAFIWKFKNDPLKLD
jgi:hypothetical protein